jgi:hypothetical protein
MAMLINFTPDQLKDISDRVKLFCTSYVISKKDLGKMLKMTNKTIYSLYYGKHPSKKTVRLFCELEESYRSKPRYFPFTRKPNRKGDEVWPSAV